MRALVVGGTGPSGPDVVAMLLARGVDVTILHRGVHEAGDAPILRQVEHIHADPHFAETLRPAVAGRSFDVVVAMYGRMVLNAAVFTGRCERFISVGGNPPHRGHLDRRSAFPEGMKILAGEHDAVTSGTISARDRFAKKVLEAEHAVMQAGADGAFRATHVRFPIVYSTRAVLAFERWAVRRLLEGRRRLPLPDGGLGIYSRVAARNAAHLLACILDEPGVATNQLYQCADDVQYSLGQWLQLIAAALERDVDIVPVPLACASPLWSILPTGPLASPHSLVDTSKARRELGYADVVSPSGALHELVHHLAADRARFESVGIDVADEDALIAGYDDWHARVVARFGDQPPEDFAPRWHPYAHPTRPLGTTDDH